MSQGFFRYNPFTSTRNISFASGLITKNAIERQGIEQVLEVGVQVLREQTAIDRVGQSPEPVEFEFAAPIGIYEGVLSAGRNNGPEGHCGEQ